MLLNNSLGKHTTMNLHHFATIFAAIVVPSLICGIYEAWTSAYVPKLEIENSFTNSDGSWITISLCVGGLTGALISFPLFDKWGRKKSLLTTTIPFMVSPLLLAFGNSVAIFCAARFFAGMGIGGCLAIIPQFVGEIAHETVRGALGTCIYVLQVFGMLFINVIGSYLSIKTSSFILFGIGVVYLLLFIFVVESPYFLIMKGENEGARKALRIFRNGGDVDSEFKRISQAVAEQIDNKGQFSDLFKIKTNRRALLIVFISVNAKQLTGDFTLDTYSQTIFNQLCDIPPMMFAVIFYSTKLIVVFISSFFIDKIGRRPTFLISLFGSGVIFLIIAAYLHIALHTDVVISDFVKKIMIFVMVLFTIFYSFLVAVPVLLLGELFPMNVKAFVSMLYVIHFFVASFVATKLFQVITDCEYLGMDVAFFAYSLSCFIHFLLVFKFVFETKGKTLEAIQEDLRSSFR
ncbi:facilitated trehalose transporter Tret1-like [Tribolium castaneum]|uniref:facilitated trehalose transporter Tret1-like n=1 Tax=Tribolium castaneum TaxID=7070 RepID=UPI00077DE373|nr:PREDICTED: facilitated trehalose transporter Tret1-like [Tribolium castaneum]|eukprot:XP_015839402.1 PREDICTED: facilitated trehalose transporter Tret1-like [Tribolium castaneum]